MGKSLARSACNVFGHRWGKPNFSARREEIILAGQSALKIQSERRCERCGEVEHVAR